MAMTEAQGEEAIEGVLTEFAQKRANLTFLTQDDGNEMNADLTARLVAALGDAWSE